MSGGLQPTGGQTAAELWMPEKLLSVLLPLSSALKSLCGALFLACALTFAYVPASSRLWNLVSRAAACWRRAAPVLGVEDAFCVWAVALILAAWPVPVTRGAAAWAGVGRVRITPVEIALTINTTPQPSPTPPLTIPFDPFSTRSYPP